MKGSIRRKGKTWSYRVYVSTVDGQNKQIEKGGFKTKKDAELALTKFVNDYEETGVYPENKKITFNEVYEEFIELEVKLTRAYATLKKYDSMYRNHFKPAFGDFYMYSITQKVLERFVNEKSEKYSEEFVKGLFKTLKCIFDYAHRKRYMKHNIFDDVLPPPDTRHVGEIKVYTPDELSAMYKRLESTNVRIPFYIALNTGLRESECMGLRWRDVNFEKKTISINKQLLYQDRRWCFCPLKTKNSYRTINISDNFVNFLKELKEQQTKNKKLYGEGYKRNFVTERLHKHKENYLEVTDLINVKENGEMLTHNSIKFLSRIIRDDLHIPFKFHNLRHTYATILAESGISPRYVQEMLGHSKLEFTLKYYTHITGHMADMARMAIDEKLLQSDNKF